MDFKDLFTVDIWIQAYLIFKVIDFITGFLKAWKVEGFKSGKLKNGLLWLVLELLLLVFSEVLDNLFGLNNILLYATKGMLVYKEAISIVENFGVLGYEVPDFIKNKIQDLKKDKEGE